MLDKRDIRFTLESLRDNIRYISMDIAEHASSVWDTIKVCVPSMVRDIKFLFDGTTAAARRAERTYSFKGTDEEQIAQAVRDASYLTPIIRSKSQTINHRVF